MLAFERIVRIEALKPNGKHSVGTGTLIAERLVLTAAHVIADRNNGTRYDTIRVVAHGRPDLFAGDSIWIGDGEMDVAFINIVDPRWTWPISNQNYLVRLGRITGRTAGVDFEAIGFPRILRGLDKTRDTEHLNGTLNPGTGIVSGRYGINVTSPAPNRPTDPDEPSPWAGLSGAALVCVKQQHQLLIGVLIRDEDDKFGGDRLTALPVHLLTTNALSRRHLAAAGYSFLVESVELAPMLVPEPHRSRESPATLLRADRGVVRFR